MSVHATAPSFSTAAKSPLVTVKVDTGSSIVTYNVHNATISYFSAYFERAFIDGIALKITVNSTIFDMFIDWIYTSKLPSKSKLSKNILFRAVVFGHEFIAPAFQAGVYNELVDCMIATRSAPSVSETVYAFGKLPSDHVLLGFLVEAHCVWGVGDAEQLRRTGQVPEEFCARVEKKGLKFVDLTKDVALRACDYHVHVTEEERWACGGA